MEENNCNHTEECNCNQTPLRDLCSDAIKHYDELATDACRYNSLIPEALCFYCKNKEKITSLESTLSLTQRALELACEKAYNLMGYPQNYQQAKAERGINWENDYLAQADKENK